VPSIWGISGGEREGEVFQVEKKKIPLSCVDKEGGGREVWAFLKGGWQVGGERTEPRCPSGKRKKKRETTALVPRKSADRGRQDHPGGGKGRWRLD